MPAVDRSYLRRGICIHNKSHNFHLILGLIHAYIFPGVGILAGELLDMTLAQRLSENLGTDAANDASMRASNRWLWPEDAYKTQPPDFLTFDEFKRLLVRLAVDKYAHVRGVTNRLNVLLFNSNYAINPRHKLTPRQPVLWI